MSRLGGGGRSRDTIEDGLAVAIAEVVAAVDDVAGLAIGILVCWVARVATLAVGRAGRRAGGRLRGLCGGGRSHGGGSVVDGLSVGEEVVAAVDDLARLPVGVLMGGIAGVAALAIGRAGRGAGRGGQSDAGERREEDLSLHGGKLGDWSLVVGGCCLRLTEKLLENLQVTTGSRFPNT